MLTGKVPKSNADVRREKVPKSNEELQRERRRGPRFERSPAPWKKQGGRSSLDTIEVGNAVADIDCLDAMRGHEAEGVPIP